jgi:hypothetical protein
MPPLPDPLGNQRVGLRSLEIRTLPALLSTGTDHLERALLSSPVVDPYHAAYGCDSLSLRRVPVQFREFPSLQGTLFVEKKSGCGDASRGSFGSKAVAGELSTALETSPYLEHVQNEPRPEGAVQWAREIKMVPSDPSISSFSDWHAQSELGIRLRRDVGPFAPRLPPLGDCGSVLRRSSAKYRSGRNLFLDTAFHSPAATADLSTNSRGRVNAPGLHLRNVPIFPTDPFGYAFPPRPAFYRLCGHDPHTQPVARIRSQDSSTVLRLSLPFRTFQSFGIVALHLIPINSGLP